MLEKLKFYRKVYEWPIFGRTVYDQRTTKAVTFVSRSVSYYLWIKTNKYMQQYELLQ